MKLKYRIQQALIVLSIIITTVQLSGCIVAAAAVGASAGGAIIYDQRTIKTMANDHYAEQVGQSRISFDNNLRNHSHVSLAVFNHVALLTGQVQTPELRDHAYQLISNIKYIDRIYNEITIGNPSSLMQRSNDTWITTKVKSAMLAEKGLQSTQFKVVTENKVVYLMGLTSQNQADIATNVARRVVGVSKVITLLQYD